MKKLVPAFLLAAALSLLGTTASHAQTGTPQSPYVITAAPYTVSKPGYYILGNNLNYAGTNGNIITVGANNVTLDFNGFYIAGPNFTASGVHGVGATERSNLTIKNGTIAYCSFGIYLYGNGSATTNAVGAVVDNMRVTYCYSYGIIVKSYLASRITNCLVSQTGYVGKLYVVAIDGSSGSSGTVIQNNVVSTVIASTAIGIYAPGGYARQNTVTNATYGVNGGKYQDNLTLGCSVPFTAGVDAGGNN